MIFLAAGLVVGILIGAFGYGLVHAPGEPSVKIERDTVTLTDTVPVHAPVPADSALVRWMVVRIPVDNPLPSPSDDTENLAVVADTVEVPLAVTQKHYQGEDYQAWVSGYRPSLDSIEVYHKTKTITETITVTQKERTKHWGLGIHGGYGFDFATRKAAPFVGVGLSYNFITF